MRFPDPGQAPGQEKAVWALKLQMRWEMEVVEEALSSQVLRLQ